MDVVRPTVDIPPRKLLLASKSFPAESSPRSSPRKHNWNNKMVTSEHEEDNEDTNKETKEYCYDSDTDDPYASEHFRIFEFKIRRCTRSRSHDWTDCPFAHPGEKARRRDPRRYQYSAEVCPEFRRDGDCSRGDDCEFAHGVFECWLHPIRYRTEACKDGKHCKRKVCFFAHSPRQLRVLPPENVSGCVSASASPAAKNPCCMFCSSSPTSTLLGNLSHLSRSPSLSPPLSPAHKAAAFSRLRNRAASAVSEAVSAAAAAGSVNYEDVLNELVNSLDTINLAEALHVSSSSPVTTPVSAAAAFASSCGLNNPRLHIQQQQSSPLQFSLSPSTPSYLTNSLSPSTPSYLTNSPRANLFGRDFTPRRREMNDIKTMAAVRDKTSFEDGSCGDPDLGWVNDLLT
ncbi:Zinc finger CCCH domain-containing protein 2 [Raphanus sativus]|uniref:Zinc finger CCCH domain-containing protein 2 n=1 Tax=Raphanus sativus TaxID=3726 RepID=A0A6J0KHI1_RAPSA|nr:zinc finger CCCH domain-containing protein 2 [Raphanus sativus]KAJ4878795.1 Zinc finger CCCH domain-containing protein 2 [Raphanus sativus]